MLCAEIRIRPVQYEDLPELSAEEKRDIIVSDPRFGMCSLTKYMLRHPKKGTCSQYFARSLCLPLFIFAAQWLMFISILIHKHADKECKSGEPAMKMLMISVSMIYFVHSFAYDNLNQNARKIVPSSSLIVALDTFRNTGLISLCRLPTVARTSTTISWMLFSTLSLSNFSESRQRVRTHLL